MAHLHTGSLPTEQHTGWGLSEAPGQFYISRTHFSHYLLMVLAASWSVRLVTGTVPDSS